MNGCGLANGFMISVFYSIYGVLSSQFDEIDCAKEVWGRKVDDLMEYIPRLL